MSATPLSAPLVLSRSTAILARYGCAFKFAAGLDKVAQLGSRQVDRGAGGKFITVYPDADQVLLHTVASELHKATCGLPGPGVLSDRRYRPGSLVHYRYGAFGGVLMLDNDGMRQAMLIAPDGTLAVDERQAWFSPPPWAPPDPFASTPPDRDPDPTDVVAPSSDATILLAGRYVVHEVIRHAFSGSVYRGLDQVTGDRVIIKQARPHTAADMGGADTCTLRRTEADLLRRLADTGVVPRPIDLFHQQGDLFLVQEYVDGCTLREWVVDNLLHTDDGRWGPDSATAARMAADLVGLVELIHRHGLVLRDLNPNNIMVTPDGTVRLIDLETAVPAGELHSVRFTPGYGPPERRSFEVADAAEDRYALGATLFYLATGADPLLVADHCDQSEKPAAGARTFHDRIRAWLAQMASGNPLVASVGPIVLALLDDDACRRPSLEAVRRQLTCPAGSTGDAPCSVRPTPSLPQASSGLDEAELTRAVEDAVGHLLATMTPQAGDRLWPTSSTTQTSDAFAVQHGSGGVLATLTRAHQCQPTAELRDGIATAANWIRRHIRREPRTLPGLSFGHAGTAWALLDAGRVLNDVGLSWLAVDLAGRLPMPWPNVDVAHGTAGAGLTMLHFFEATGQPEFLTRATYAADSIVQVAQRQDGTVIWRIPPDFPSKLAGARHFGFAHGLAGIGMFLLAAGVATGTPTYLMLAGEAATTLAKAAQFDSGAVYWPAASGGRPRTHWCSGSSGVGTFLLRYWQHTGDDSIKGLVHAAATAVYRSRWHVGPSQCHGLAGDGDFLLDLASALGHDGYHLWAQELAGCIQARATMRHGRLVAPNDTGTEVVADFGVGLAGILAFLLRLRHGGARMWLPQACVRATADGPRPTSEQLIAADHQRPGTESRP